VVLGPPRADLDHGKKIFWAPQQGQISKNLYIEPKDWLSVAEWLELGLKGLIGTIDK